LRALRGEGAPSWFAALPKDRDFSPERSAALAGLVSIRDQGARLVDVCLRHGLHRSSLLGTLAIRKLNALGRRRNEQQEIVARVRSPEPGREQREESGPVYAGSQDDALELGVRIWGECSKALHQLCEPRSIAYLHVLQPALHDEGSKPMSAGEIAIEDPNPEWTRAAREGYPLLRAAGRKLSEAGVHFVDATRVFDGIEETLYQDPCHFSKRGNEILRHLVVAELLHEMW